MHLPLVGLLAACLLVTATAHAQMPPLPAPGQFSATPRPAFDHLLPLPDGRCLAAGDFRFLDGVPLNHLTRLNADGSVDPSFDSGEAVGDVTLHGIAVQSDRRILVYGDFKEYRGEVRHRIARLLPNGNLDDSFHPPTDTRDYSRYPITTAALAPADQGIYIGGNFAGSGYGSVGLARLRPDGSLDDTFKPDPTANGSAAIHAVAVDAEGRVLAAGSYSTGYGVRRFLPDGSLDRTFKKVTLDQAGSRFVCQPDGRILMAGSFTHVNGIARTSVVRLLPDGAVDAGFQSPSELAAVGGSFLVRDLELLSDGSLVIAGEQFSAWSSAPLLRRLLPDGSLDTMFTDVFDAKHTAWRRVAAIAVDGSGSLIASGTFRIASSPAAENFARFSLGEIPTALALRATTNGVQALAQVHPGRRMTLESAVDPSGPWTSLASTNPVASGVWCVRHSSENQPVGFFRIR